MHRIGIVTVRGKDYHPTRRLAKAAARRGAQVVVIHPYRHPVGIDPQARLLLPEPDGGSLDALLPRQGAEIKTACLPLIAQYEAAGVPVVNGLHAIMTVRHKFLAMQAFAKAGLHSPATVYVGDTEAYSRAVEKLGPGPVVVKPIRGRQGTGIACLGPEDALPDVLRAELDAGNGLLVQTFIDPSLRQDLRVLVVGGQVAGAMTLTPSPGEFRANVHLGGRARATHLSDAAADTALRAARAVGLEIAGVDLMLHADGSILVLEANYSPGFRGLEKASGLDIAGRMIDHVLSRIRQANPERT